MSRKRSSSTSETQKKVTLDDELQKCSNRIKELVIENSDIKKQQKEYEKNLNEARKELKVLSSKLKKNNKSISLDDIKLKNNNKKEDKKEDKKQKEKELNKLKKQKEKELKQLKKQKEKEEKEKEKIAQKRSKEVVDFDPKERAVLIVSTNDKKKQSFTRTMEDFFIDKLGFQQSDILKITDPKKLNVLDGIDRLIEAGNDKGCKELWFLYSGDGILIKNLKENDIS